MVSSEYLLQLNRFYYIKMVLQHRFDVYDGLLMINNSFYIL